MDISKGRNKKSRKCYKKITKFLNYMQKQTIPKNYHSGTEKLVHQSIQIANVQTKKYPVVYPDNSESCKYYIVKRRFTVKQRKLGECMSNLQEQTPRCKQNHINRFFIAPSSCALEMNGYNKFLKKKYPSVGIKKCYEPYHNSVSAVKNKLFHTKSLKSKISTNQREENVCIMNNELNSENALMFQCSAASLQLEKSNIIETKKPNLNENYNNINDIIPKLMQQVTVYRMLENLKQEHSYQNNSEDNMYSSMSTCSSSSSTREYYLPAVSSSTDTMHVANVLANRRLVELSNPQKEITNEHNSNQGICKNSYNKNNSNLPPVYQETAFKNEIIPFNNIGMKEVRLDEPKTNNQQIIKILKDNNDGLLPLFPFANFNSLVIKNKSNVIKNYEQSSIRGQTQENKVYEKDEDDSNEYKPIKNKRIKLSKENFIVNNNTKHNESLDITMEKTKKKLLNSVPLVTTQNCKKLMNNINKANKEVIKILGEQLYDTYLHTNGKEKISLDYNGSNTKIRNMSTSKNNSISEEVLITIKNKGNKAHQIKKVIQKPKSSLYISNMKSESSELPLHYKSYANASNDSLNVSKPYFVKLNPFFDAGFKDPKISRLILSSKTLAGESDSTIDKAKIHTEFTNGNAETFAKQQSKEKYLKSATMSETAKRTSINEENKLEAKNKCNSNRSIFSTDSIVYGSKTFQKIREKFDLIKNKIQINKENKHFQEQGPLHKQRVSTTKHSWEEYLEGLNNGKDNSQSIDNNNMNVSALSNSCSMNENPTEASKVPFENEGFSDKKYLLLLPKTLDISNHQSQHTVKDPSHIDKKEKTIGLSSILGKSIDISVMDDEHELTNINLKSSSSNGLIPLLGKSELKKIEKGTVHTQYSLEKQTQVNMYLGETSEKKIDAISNEMPFTKNEVISTAVSDKVAQTTMLDDSQAEVTMLNNNSQKEAIMFNNNSQTEATMFNNSQIEATMFNNSQIEAIMFNNNSQTEATMFNNNSQIEAITFNNNSQTEAIMFNNNSQTEATMLNNNAQAETTRSNNNGHEKATMLNNYGKPVILYNSSGYPITDLNGRVLKNNLGAYLLNSDKYADVITKQLPVFDCDLMSVGSTCFNPTKVPYAKIQLKITDRCGNPVSLFNNLGWPLTNEGGFFLHDNHGKLLVEMDSFNFPLCCSNGSPIYLKNGAMLLSQKFKFIVTKPGSDSNCTVRPLKIERRYENEVVSSYDKKDNKINSIMPINCNKKTGPINGSNPKDFKSSKFQKPKERKPNFKYNLFLPTEVPELMHEFFDNKARPRFSNFRNQGSIPQSPIPIFDRAGNRLTDEDGFPLKNKYGEYMLLLDKNGIALSDSCGGPIFDSNGKQLWLKNLYHMKKNTSFNYLFDRYTPPEHPYIDISTSDNNENTHDSSDEVIPLLDLNFENEQSSEPIMNYIKENNIKAYDMDVKNVHFVQNKYCRTNKKPKQTNFLKNVSIPTNGKHYLQPPMTTIKENLLFYETRSYQEAEYDNLYESFRQQIHDSNIPYTYDDNVFSEQHPQVNNLEPYDNNYYYYNDQGCPENSEFHQDAEIKYYIDDNNYVVYY